MLSANLAVLLAMAGHRTALIDIDVTSPSAQLLFGLQDSELVHTVNGYLLGKCAIEQTVHDLSPRLEIPDEGRLFLIPSGANPSEITPIIRRDFDVDLLDRAFQELVVNHSLDMLIVDTPSGINDDTLVTVASADALVVVMRLDKLDYQGTGVILDLARRLEVPRLDLVVNQVSASFNSETIKAEVTRTYGCEVAAILPSSPRLMSLGSGGIFVLRYPGDPLTGLLWQLMTVVADADKDFLPVW